MADTTINATEKTMMERYLRMTFSPIYHYLKIVLSSSFFGILHALSVILAKGGIISSSSHSVESTPRANLLIRLLGTGQDPGEDKKNRLRRFFLSQVTSKNDVQKLFLL